MKQAIVIDMDLEMSKGKMIAQACHASLNGYLSSDEKLRDDWLKKGGKKIVLEKGDHSFETLIKKAERLNIPFSKVSDAGKTELRPGTETAICLGPDKESKIDEITSEMKLVD